MEPRVIHAAVLKGIGAALGVGIGLMPGVGMGFQGNMVRVEVGGTVMGRGLKTADMVVYPIGLEAF